MMTRRTSFCVGRTDGARSSARTRHSRPTPTSATTHCSTSTFTATRVEASAPVTRRGGPGWLPSCLSRPEEGRPLCVEHAPLDEREHADKLYEIAMQC